jgi:flagellar assembly factor FliW
MAAPEAVEPIRLETRFGAFEAGTGSVIRFPAGLPGFENCREFVLLSGAGHLQCLYAVSGGPAAFLAVDPRRVLAGYRCRLSADDRARLNAGEGSLLLWLALLSVGPEGQLQANLRAPIVIDPASMRGFQIAPHQAVYPLRYPLKGL